MAVRPGGLTRPGRTAGLALALAIAAVGALSAVGAARAAADAHLEGARDAAEADAARLASVVEEAALATLALADGPATEGVAAFRQAAPTITGSTSVRAVALASVGPDRVPAVVTTSPAPRPPLARGEPWDDGGLVEMAVTRLAPVVGPTPDGAVVTVAPVPALPSSEPLGARRAAVRFVVAGLVDVAGATAGAFDGADVRVESDTGTVLARGDADGSLLETDVAVLGDTWTVAVDDPGRAVGWVPWAILAGSLVVAAAGGAAFATAVRARDAADERAEVRTRQLGRIAETGGRIQQTLDLAELLPVFAITLADEFDLRHVAVSLVDDEGRDVEAFATGDRDAGAEPFALPLRRGLRHVGFLSVQPRRPLDEAERTSIQTLGDLLAVALTNARLLQREQEAAARLRELDALKNAFLGTVSHELRTSMTAILGFGDLLVDAWDELSDDRRRELAERVRRSGGSLRHLVDDLLDFARLEQQRLRVSPRELDLGEVVRHTVEALGSLLVEHEVVLHADDGVHAYVDPVAVERIVANLVSNAAKYAPAGTRVTVAVEATGDRARVVVADQGPGIPAAERSRVFVRFYRLDNEATLRSRGAGIGLSIVRDFAERSGAPITIDDAPGGGARFTIDFPTTAAALPAESEAATS